jgi:hypothetical protein
LPSLIAGALAAVVACGCTTPGDKATPLTFIAIGDTPYGPEDVAMLERALPAIRALSPAFVIHLGDYKSGAAPCEASHDLRQRRLIDSLVPLRVYYTPGDNEWTDCDRALDPATGRPLSELARLETLRLSFFSDAARPPPAERQEGHPENATWTSDGVRVALVHAVGSNNGRQAVMGDELTAAGSAADIREAAGAAWIRHVFARARLEKAGAVIIGMQADMTDLPATSFGRPCPGAAAEASSDCDGFAALRRSLKDETARFDGPVLLLHGDTAPFTLNQQIGEPYPLNLWRLNAMGDAPPGREGARDVTIVTVRPGSDPPFAARGLLTGDTPTP